MRAREFEALGSTTWDVLVVGGGIHGLATALDASARWLSVALVEAADFAAATSFNHQRTAHGGLRSLQSGRIGYARESIRERRALARIAPRLLRPLPFMIGTYRSFMKNRLALRAAFKFDAWLGRHRNDGLEPELHLPVAKLTSRAATLKLFPGVRQEGLTGGANWYDYQILYSSRLAIAFAEGADARGARLVNYAEAIAALKEPGRVSGMRVRDRLTGSEIDVRARITVNCAGSRINQVMGLFGVTGHDLPMALAMNLVTSKRASDMALAASAFATATADKLGGIGRMLTLTPWHGRALIGTWLADDFATSPDVVPSNSDIEAFIAEANSAFPALKLTRADLTLVHRGVVPATKGSGGRPEILPRPQIVDHGSQGTAGAMTVVGVKFTTARAVGAKAAATAARALGTASRSTDTDRAILPGAGIADHEALSIETARAVGLELAPPIIRHITTIYGDRCAAIVRLMAEQTDWRMPLVPGRPTVGAEVIHAIRNESACTLADIVIRRTELGAMGHPGDDMVKALANVAAEELGWDAGQQADEIAAIDQFYAHSL